MDIEELLTAIEQSALSAEERSTFSDWLKARSSMQITLWNAVRRGQSLKALLVKRSARSAPEFTVQINE